MNKRQQGFTLIELLISIVVIGVLAAGSTFFYRDTVGQAKVALVQDTSRALRQNSQLVALMAGARGNLKGAMNQDGEQYTLSSGSLSATEQNMLMLLGISGHDWQIEKSGSDELLLRPRGVSEDYAKNCYIRYIQAHDGLAQRIELPDQLACG
ncbi:type IV pilin protein [Dongshaea marina]|uniref:type IV pilin protein n=1 Tax=Dongshaea marina TaxID=2047966 RepID=UPI000D3E07CC|nr:prepilin-type N-terminal cleavage/methylation domain-containing protein [Dongshaea marina]